MRIVLLVEGDTEHRSLPDFFKRYLDPRLKQPVTVQTVKHKGYSDLVKEARKKARMYLDEPRKGEGTIAVVALLDLYGPTYPDSVKGQKERLAWLQQQVKAGDTDPRFLVRCAVHELEAWLLSDPGVFRPEIRRALPGARPEEVNHDEPPGKLLERLYREKLGRSYHKLTDGVNLFARLAPDKAAERCPHLGEIFQTLLARAQQRGL